MDWEKLFCDVDDFCLDAEPLLRQRLLTDGQRRRNRKGRLTASEIITILIAFHQGNFRTFKHFYLMLGVSHSPEFPDLVSYQRFVELMPSVLVLMCGYLKSRFGSCTGISFIDSTALAVCGNKRIERNRVFRGIARIGKTTMGWFFGFKLHLVINECGELLGVRPVNSILHRRVSWNRGAHECQEINNGWRETTESGGGDTVLGVGHRLMVEQWFERS